LTDSQGDLGVHLDELIEKYGQVQPEQISLQITQQTQILAQELAAKTLEAKRLEKQLTALHNRINELAYSVLPDLFNEQGITQHTLANGVSLELNVEYKASLPAKMDPFKKENALSYLRQEAPEIIKTKISMTYGVDENQLANTVIKILNELSIDPEVKEDVHWSTLTSWIKERFLAGEEVPLQRLNATIKNVVKIKLDRDEKYEVLERVRKLNEDETNEAI